MPKKGARKTFNKQIDDTNKITNHKKENIHEETLKTKSKLQELKSPLKANENEAKTSNARSATQDTCCSKEEKESASNRNDNDVTNGVVLDNTKHLGFTKGGIDTTTIWQPINWQKTLDNIRKMLSAIVTPVDTMGCHKCHDQSADEKTQRFHILVALMLSSQTKHETTYQAMMRLKEQALTPQSILNMKLKVLENILRPVSFYKTKAKRVQQVAKILNEQYSSDIPDNIKDLVALPGVGPKMAHICMSAAWYKVTGCRCRCSCASYL